MKQTLFTLLIFLSSLLHAQITIHNSNTNTDIHQGDTVVTNQDHTPTYVTVTNNYSFDINLKLTVVSINNTDGREMSLCFGVNGMGQCLNQIQTGAVYDGGAALTSGATTGHNDIDFNHIEGNNGASFSNYPKDYVFKLSALRASDNSILEEITFTYRYDPNAQNIDHFENHDFKVKSLTGNLLVETPVATQLFMYNMTGQQVKEFDLSEGKNYIDTADLNKGIYILRAKSGQLDIYKKIIIK